MKMSWILENSVSLHTNNANSEYLFVDSSYNSKIDSPP